MSERSIHTTRMGTNIRIDAMEDSHLINTMAFFKRRAKEGVHVREGGGSSPDDFWYDEHVVYGEEALEHLNFRAFEEEAIRRGLPGDPAALLLAHFPTTGES